MTKTSFLGRKHSKESNEKNRLSHLGRKYSKEHREAISKALKGKNYGRIGENHPRWIKDRTKLVKRQERNDSAYYAWRREVWLRDNFKCKIANPDCLGKIVAHHILPWSKFPELRYQINNGITLCQAHHPRKRAEEKRLSPYFQKIISGEIVSVSKE